MAEINITRDSMHVEWADSFTPVRPREAPMSSLFSNFLPESYNLRIFNHSTDWTCINTNSGWYGGTVNLGMIATDSIISGIVRVYPPFVMLNRGWVSDYGFSCAQGFVAINYDIEGDSRTGNSLSQAPYGAFYRTSSNWKIPKITIAKPNEVKSLRNAMHSTNFSIVFPGYPSYATYPTDMSYYSACLVSGLDYSTEASQQNAARVFLQQLGINLSFLGIETVYAPQSYFPGGSDRPSSDFSMPEVTLADSTVTFYLPCWNESVYSLGQDLQQTTFMKDWYWYPYSSCQESWNTFNEYYSMYYSELNVTIPLRINSSPYWRWVYVADFHGSYSGARDGTWEIYYKCFLLPPGQVWTGSVGCNLDALITLRFDNASEGGGRGRMHGVLLGFVCRTTPGFPLIGTPA